jgi:hypothetical protein
MKAKVGPTTVPIASGKAKAASSYQPQSASANTQKSPNVNKSLVCSVIATPTGVDASNNDHPNTSTGAPSTKLQAGFSDSDGK